MHALQGAKGLLVFVLFLLLCAPAFAEHKSFDLESLRVIIDNDWAAQGAPGYLPVRFDITNLAEAREIEIVATAQRIFGSTYPRGRVVVTLPGVVNSDTRQTVRLKRGDRVRFTMALPVFASGESFRFSLLENGRPIEGFTSYASFQSGMPLADSPVLMVTRPTTPMATLTASWKRAAPSASYYYGARTYAVRGPSVGALDFTLEPERLPTNWLGFTSLRGVLIGFEEWKELTPAQQDALLTWTASGGDLFLVDEIPDTGFPLSRQDFEFSSNRTIRPYFFGHIHLMKSEKMTAADFAGIVEDPISLPEWALPANRASDWGIIRDRGFRLPIEGAGLVSVRAYLSILVLFVAIIGPVNYIYLWRKRRQVLMVITAPLISACFIVLMAAYGVLAQGFDVRARAVTFTMLDQNSKQAATRSSVSLYPGGVTPGAGLRFPSNVAVFPLGRDGAGSRDRLNLELTNEQRFTTGLLTPRSPTNFEQVAFGAARERLAFERNGDTLSVVNGFGSTLHRLFYRDGGQVYSLESDLPAGETAPMRVDTFTASDLYTERLLETAISPGRFQEVFDNQSDGTYLAVLETSPFWVSGVSSAKESDSLHIVFGYGVRP